ncbi:MAG: transglutaminase domain-containing protein [Pseudomonadales bacterium]|jgi:hypothetical protein|nr:transglutaminase domain-containing protein [Pseudomonadales bacterium]
MKIAIILAAIFSFVFVKSVDANTDISAELNSEYTIIDGTFETRVVHDFTVTNTSPLSFIDSYQIILDNDNFNALIVNPKEERIESTIEYENRTTRIDIQFLNEVVGQGRYRNWSIEYNDPNVANFTGQTLVVNVPILASAYTYNQYSLIINIPSHFGEPNRINLEPDSVTLVGGNLTRYVWYSTGDLKNINMVFGTEQLIDFTLRYELQNISNDSQLQQIALPSSDGWQIINYHEFSPQPKSWTVDGDGNYLATFLLRAHESITIAVSGQAVLKDHNYQPLDLSAEKHLGRSAFWEVGHSDIINFIGNVDTIEDIYRKIIDEIRFSDDENTPRQGARRTIEQGEGNSRDLADLFITILRTRNVPARLVTGWLNDGNRHTLHYWVEFYDEGNQVWRRADPGLEALTGIDYFNNFDFFHFSLIKNGISSQIPTPPNIVQTNFAYNAVDIGNPELEIQIQMRRIGGIPIPGIYEAVIINKTGISVPIQLNTNVDFSIIGVRNEQINLTILPFEYRHHRLGVYNRRIWNILRLTPLAVQITNQEEDIDVAIAQEIVSFSFIGLAIIGSVFGFAGVGWSILVARRKK